jgi:uncharacterized membrane protein
MTLKKVLGSILTFLGIITLLYGAYIFISEVKTDWKTLIVCSILGMIFFSAGIGLIKGIKD